MPALSPEGKREVLFCYIAFLFLYCSVLIPSLIIFMSVF